MLTIYAILTRVAYYVAMLCVGPFALAGSLKWRRRLGFGFPSECRGGIWAHASSVGEAVVACAVVEKILVLYPEERIAVSAMTDGGVASFLHRLSEHTASGRVTVGYCPLDTTPGLERAVSRLAPRLMIFTETEIWPLWITALTTRNIPIALINARISPRSFPKYRRLRGVLTKLFDSYTAILCQSHADAERYLALGAKAETVIVTGNLKTSAAPKPLSLRERKELRARMDIGEGEFLMVAGSVRPGEDPQLLRRYARIRHDNPRLRLALTPRHLERCNEIEDNARALGLAISRLSAGGQQNGVVILIDQMGALCDMYGAADIAFVGGTMAPIGGHNVLEPVQMGCPVIFGPHTENIAEIAESIVAHNYGARAHDWSEFETIVRQCISGERSFEPWRHDILGDDPLELTMRHLARLLEVGRESTYEVAQSRRK